MSPREPTPTDRLLLAFSNHDLATLERLAAEGVGVDERDRAGRTVLLLAAGRGDAEAVAWILQAGADVEAAAGERRETALHRAAAAGHTKIVETLLSAGARADHANADGECALFLAARGGHLDTVRRLVRSGADLERETRHGETALDAARTAGHSEVARLLEAVGTPSRTPWPPEAPPPTELTWDPLPPSMPRPNALPIQESNGDRVAEYRGEYRSDHIDP